MLILDDERLKELDELREGAERIVSAFSHVHTLDGRLGAQKRAAVNKGREAARRLDEILADWRRDAALQTALELDKG